MGGGGGGGLLVHPTFLTKIIKLIPEYYSHIILSLKYLSVCNDNRPSNNEKLTTSPVSICSSIQHG